MKRLHTIGKMCAFCILCLIIVLGLTSCAKDVAVKNFNATANDIKQLQNNLANEIVSGQNLLANTNAKDLADQTLLEQLRGVIDSEKQYSVDVPKIASDTDAINRQVKNLATTKVELQKHYDALHKSVDAINESKQKLQNQIAAEKEKKIQEAITPKDIHSITVIDNNGNKEKITVKISSWIKGSETNMLQRAWNNVGGEGEMPLNEDSYSGAGLTGIKFSGKNGAFVFGTVSIQNMTPDFPAKDFGNGDSRASLSLRIPNGDPNKFFTDWRDPGFEGFGNIVQARQYGDEHGGKKVDKGLVGGAEPLVRADMTSNNWGPVPFAIGIDTVFSPKNPNGNPKMDDIYFFLGYGGAFFKTEGDARFQIGKTW